MTFEEVKKIREHDHNDILRESNINVVSKEDEKETANLLLFINDYFNGNNKGLINRFKIKKHKLVNTVTFEKEHIYMETKYGKGDIYSLESFFLGKVDFNDLFQHAKCHSNSITLASLYYNQRPEHEVKVLTGIERTITTAKTRLHSICSVNHQKRGYLYLDPADKMGMSPEIYNMFFNYEILSEYDPKNTELIFGKFDKCNKKLKSEGKESCHITDLYCLMATEETINYLDDIIEGKRDNDFDFSVKKYEVFKKEK
ncbi:MAG: hypothetical protein E7184_01765 [Erysipelotrichaceae bacterium]|nr:hypothetical protein [Erysipelotrichaceae bacterium]